MCRGPSQLKSLLSKEKSKETMYIGDGQLKSPHSKETMCRGHSHPTCVQKTCQTDFSRETTNSDSFCKIFYYYFTGSAVEAKVIQQRSNFNITNIVRNMYGCKEQLQPGTVVTHAFNSSTLEAEAGR